VLNILPLQTLLQGASSGVVPTLPLGALTGASK
jgi:hypothetical protein